jgi:hypothetical protein
VNNKLSMGDYILWPGESFDCINRRIILDKLEFYGSVGKFHLLMQSYLYEISKSKEYLRIIQLLTIRSHTPAGKWLKQAFYKAQFLVLWLFFFISIICPR